MLQLLACLKLILTVHITSRGNMCTYSSVWQPGVSKGLLNYFSNKEKLEIMRQRRQDHKADGRITGWSTCIAIREKFQCIMMKSRESTVFDVTSCSLKITVPYLTPCSLKNTFRYLTPCSLKITVLYLTPCNLKITVLYLTPCSLKITFPYLTPCPRVVWKLLGLTMKKRMYNFIWR
jgi:hypothetical protein